MCQKSGAMGHPADRDTPHTWHDGHRGSQLQRTLLDHGWRDFQPSDRTPVKGILLGGEGAPQTVWLPTT